MRYLIFICIFLLIGKISIAQDADTMQGTLKIRKYGQEEFESGTTAPPLFNYLPTINLAYPPAVDTLNITVPVLIGVKVDANGKTIGAWIVRGVHPVLDNVALNHLKNWNKTWAVKNTQFSVPVYFHHDH
jgi:hypothetical protein